MESRVSGSKIIDVARGYLGVPFRHRGRNRAGVDCAGLVICALRDLLVLPDDYIEQRYSRTPVVGLVEDTLLRFCKKVEAPRCGDILLLSFLHNPCHVAFYAGNSIVHAYEERGKVIEDEYAVKWEKRFISAFEVVR